MCDLAGVQGGLWARLRHYKASVSLTAVAHSCNASAKVSLAPPLYGTRDIARSCSAHSVGLDDGELEGDLRPKDWRPVSIRVGFRKSTAALYRWQCAATPVAASGHAALVLVKAEAAAYRLDCLCSRKLPVSTPAGRTHNFCVPNYMRPQEDA